MHTFVNEEMLGLPVSTLGALERMVEELSFERVMELISILAARVVGTASSAEAQQEGLSLVQNLDPDHGSGDDARQGSEDQQAGQRPPQPILAVKAKQRARNGDQVVEEVGRRDRRTRRVKDADLDRD